MATTATDPDRLKALRAMFAEDRKRFEERGWFKRRYGFGERPALLVIDLQNCFTRAGHPWCCDGMETIIPATQELLAAARGAGAPVIFTKTAFGVTDGPIPETGTWARKVPVELLRLDDPDSELDERIAPEPGEVVILKKRTSAFYGTELASILAAAQIDTLIITGVALPACVRHTAEDAAAAGFPPIVVREAVGDRVAGAVEWNLFDIDARVADVESLDAVTGYLRGR